jgi:glycosyltransferase involved in cell wall biosynthesis
VQEPKVIVCIPAYNEAKNIADVIRKAKPYAGKIVVCDDGSIDDTAKIAEDAGAIVVRHATNEGYGAAIKTLFQKAKEEDADVMVTIDSDGQHNPDQIPNIIELILTNQADVVIGSRFLVKGTEEKIPAYRIIGIKTITKFAHMVSYRDITDAQSGFRAYNRKALSSIQLTEEGMAVSTEILVKVKDNKLRVKEVPVTISYDVEDASTHNPFLHGLGVMNSIIKFISMRHPLAFYGIPGLTFLIIAGIFTALTIDLYLTQGLFSLNMTVLSIGLGIFGLILILAAITFYFLADRKRDPIGQD